MWILFMRLTGSFSAVVVVVFNYMFSRDFAPTFAHLVYDKYQPIGQHPGRILIQRDRYNRKSKQSVVFHKRGKKVKEKAGFLDI